MTYMHKFKLFFAHIRWYLLFIKEAVVYSEKVKEYKTIKDLRRVIYLRFLKAERENKEEVMKNREIELKLLDKVLNG